MFGLSILIAAAVLFAVLGLLVSFQGMQLGKAGRGSVVLAYGLALVLFVASAAAGYEGYQRSRMIDSQRAAHKG
jgi:hypothetical protein